MGQFNPFVGATSGGGGTGTTNYQELTNKPKINGIQLNGNKTMVDLGVFYGASLNASINTSTYIMTLQLKDQQGNILGTPQTIDLPLETVVVGGRYDDQTKRVILTLQNGNTINFSIADLIDGLQAEITSENRLDADLINDTTSINKFVTEAEKTNWNNKVDQISGKGLSTNDYTTTDKNKLAGIEAQANKTIVDGTLDSSSTNPVQNKVVKEALDTKQASLTAAQLAAVNSGITSADVDQIETNKNNISSVREQANWNSNNGVKNICPYNSGATPTGEGTVWNNLPIDIAAGTYSVSFSTDSTASALVLLAADGVTEVLRKTYSATTVNDTFTISVAAKYIRLYIGAPKTVSNFMIRPDFAESTYQPYAKSNSDLTALSAEDRASLVELVDEGAKNLLKNELGSGTKSGLAYTTGTDGSIVITAGTATRGNADFVIPFTPKESGQYVLQGCPSGGSGETYKGQIVLYPSMTNVAEIFDNTSVTATLTGGTQYAYRFRVYNGKSISDSTIYPMVCTKAAWDISQAYVPYAKTNPELTVLTDEDRDALVEIVDGGAKNKLSISSPTSIPAGLTCVRNNDGTYTVSGTLAAANSISFNIGAIEGDLVLSGCPAGGGDNSYLLRITKSGSQVAGSVDTGNGSDVFTMDGTGYALNIRFAAGTYDDLIFKPMICSKAAWDISQSYQPYRPSYQELYEIVLALQGGNY